MSDLTVFSEKLKAIFENVDYSTQLQEDAGEQKEKYSFTAPDGKVYEIEFEASEQEYYVYQNGQQVDLFNANTIETDAKLPKEIRQQIIQANPKLAKIENTPIEEPVAENKEVIAKFKDQYGEKEGEKVYYATANAQGRDPETFEKK